MLRQELRQERQEGWRQEQEGRLRWPTSSSSSPLPTLMLSSLLFLLSFSSRSLSAAGHQLGESKKLEQRKGRTRESAREEKGSLFKSLSIRETKKKNVDLSAKKKKRNEKTL